MNSRFFSKIPVLVLFLFTAGICPASSPFGTPELPPVLEMFPEDTLLYLSFDDGTSDPDFGYFPKGTVRAARNVFMEDGLLGKALESGTVSFNFKDSLPTDTSGTILMWVRLLETPPPQRMEPACTFFSVLLNSSTRRMLGCKGAGVNYWGKENMICRIEFPGTASGKRRFVRNVVPGSGSSVVRDWPTDEWRMFAFTWSSEKIGISVNGGPVKEEGIPEPLCIPEKISLQFSAGVPAGKQEGLRFAIDDCAVFRRKLSDRELSSLYQAVLNRRAARRAGK